MTQLRSVCPDCEGAVDRAPDRRRFLQQASAGAALALASPVLLAARDLVPEVTPETLVKELYETMSDGQRREICFDWDYMDKQRGLLRTRVANNWHITKPTINSSYFTDRQREMVRAIFEGMIEPDWHGRIDKQLEDDAGGFGESQNIAIFGQPGDGKFEFVMTGRHMTLRCDGNSTDHVAFGGPIFYGHAAKGFNEEPDHPENVFWEQALVANKVYEMLDGKQRDQALVPTSPREQSVGFRQNRDEIPGLPVSEMSADQKEQVQRVLQKLIEPYRKTDRDEVVACLAQQGGLDQCRLAFYADDDLGGDRVWDNWRLEGPSFVWYFRGAPHVHVWVNVADNPSVKTNT